MTEIAVLGAGIGGLAAALALHHRGMRPRVYEQAPALTELGAGIQISPNGWRVLCALGLGEAAQARSQRADQVRLLDGETGMQVARLPLAGRDYHFFHRADLIDLLAARLADCGIPIHLDTKVTRVSAGQGQGKGQAGPRLRTPAGEIGCDLLIGADGLHSVAFDAVCGPARPQFTGQVAWRATIPAREGEPPEVQVHMGDGRHLVRYPLRGGRLLNLVGVEEREAWAADGWHHATGPDPFRKAFATFTPTLRADLDRVESAHLWGLHVHPVAPSWHRGGVILLGDAAHPTLPFLAQGANMALEDAWVLAHCLADGSGPARYEALRKPRSTRIVAAARANATNYHLPPGPKRTLAHTALRLASGLAPSLLTARFNWLYDHDVTRT